MKTLFITISLLLSLNTISFAKCYINKYKFDINPKDNYFEYSILFGDNNNTLKKEFHKRFQTEKKFIISILSRPSYKAFLAMESIGGFKKEELDKYFSKIKDKNNKIIMNVLEHKYSIDNWKRFIYNQKRRDCSIKLKDYDKMRVAAGLYSYYKKTKDQDAYMVANSIGLNFWFNWFKTHSDDISERIDSYSVLFYKYNLFKDKYIKELKTFCENDFSDKAFIKSLILFKLEANAKNAKILKSKTTIVINNLLNIGDYNSARSLKSYINDLILKSLKI